MPPPRARTPPAARPRPPLQVATAGCGVALLGAELLRLLATRGENSWQRLGLVDLGIAAAGVLLLAVAARPRDVARQWAVALGALAALLAVLRLIAPAAGLGAPPARDRAAAGTHLVGTWDGERLTLYVDGRRAARTPASGPVDPGSPFAEIGSYFGGARWRGAVDEVAVYERALDPATVLDHYRAGATRGPPAYAAVVRATAGLQAWWRLDERSGRAARDSALGRFHGVYGPGARQGAESLLAERDDAAVSFDGRPGIAAIGRAHDLAAGAFSLEAWVRPAALAQQPHLLAARCLVPEDGRPRPLRGGRRLARSDP